MVVNSGPGSSDVYGRGPKRLLQWTVRWKRLGVALSQNGPKAGQMLGVQGVIVAGPQAGLTITADEGRGSRDNQQLDLKGHVTVRSKDGRSVLTCDALKYVAPTKLLFATGNVRFRNPVGSLGAFQELMATSDLKKVATPEDFNL